MQIISKSCDTIADEGTSLESAPVGSGRVIFFEHTRTLACYTHTRAHTQTHTDHIHQAHTDTHTLFLSHTHTHTNVDSCGEVNAT